MCGFILIPLPALFKTAQPPISLKEKLESEIGAKKFSFYNLEISDLQSVEILSKRKNLGKGELSSIAFPRKVGIAFLTDDQGLKLGESFLDSGRVRTTPHLMGWLFFVNKLIDSDKDKIISEHEQLNGKLRRYFEEIYQRALLYKANSRNLL